MRKLVITFKEDDNNTLTIECMNMGGFSAVELVGMLEAKKADIIEQMNHPELFKRHFITESGEHIEVIKEGEKEKTDELVEYKYEVDVGSGCGTGSVFVPESATDDEILLKIMHDLYDVSYEKVQEEAEDE